MPDEEDAQLYARWREGDERAGRTLFRRHAPSVLRFFRGKIPERAEDLAQEVFARFLGDRRAEVAVRPFLFGIARNVLREALRNRDDSYDEGVTSIVDLAGPSNTGLQQRHVLLRALQALPVGQQIAIELHYWEGMSSAELGLVLGISASAARTRLDTARERLRVSLGKSFPKRPITDFDDLEAWAHQIRDLCER